MCEREGAGEAKRRMFLERKEVGRQITLSIPVLVEMREEPEEDLR